VLGVALSVLSYFLMSSELLTEWMLVPVLLTLAPGILYALPQTSKVVANKAVFLLVLCIIIFSLQPLVYPKAIGLAIPIDAVTTAGAMADAFLSITAIGGLLLAVMLLIYIRVAAKGPSGPDLPSP